MLFRNVSPVQQLPMDTIINELTNVHKMSIKENSNKIFTGSNIE